MMDEYLSVSGCLPNDADDAVLVGRVWLPGEPAGPAVVSVRGDGIYDLTPHVPTMAELCAAPDPVALALTANLSRVGDLSAVLTNSRWDRHDPNVPWLLAPVDLQAVKAAGVTFARSMIERVVEERAKGDPSRADVIRAELVSVIGGDLRSVEPGSPGAARLKAHLEAEGAWSQYLEVGIGPDAEIFTKAQPMASVGHGAEVGLHPVSTWNNPEPELVLVVSPTGRIAGASLGNDANLRDVEGRSALLLGKAKDNNAASAIGPFIRLLDDQFTVETLRAAEITMRITGDDGFSLEATSSMREISRDVLDLVRHAWGDHHQYPDGFALYCGTMFAPTEDRDASGKGFTHHLGDVVAIAEPRLGTLANRVQRSDRAAPWNFGAVALMRNLAARGMLAPR